MPHEKQSKYLLYIDILGFSELIKHDIDKVKIIFTLLIA